MPAKRYKRKTMKGGFWNSLSSWGSSLSNEATGLWEKTKKATSNLTDSSSQNKNTDSSQPQYQPEPQSPPFPTPPPMPKPPSKPQPMPQPMPPPPPLPPPQSSTYGGKSKKRRMKGGFKDNTPTSGIALNAGPFSGKTAQPHNWVGGRRKTINNRNKKRKHNKSRRCRR